MNKLVFTEMPVNGTDCIVYAEIEDGKTGELSFSPLDCTGILGNIYIGQVNNVLQNIQGAFVRIAGGQICFFSLKEQEQAIYTNGKKKVNGRYVLKAGDQLLVQVAREEMRGKRPTVTSKLEFHGKYLILVTGVSVLKVSAKLPSDIRRQLREWLEPEITQSYGLIVRTNAGTAQKENIFQELEILKKRMEKALEKGNSRTAYSLVEEAQPFYLDVIRNAYTENLEEIVTDVPAVYEKIHEHLKEYQPEDLPKLRLYQDSLLPLYKLYALEQVLESILKKRVWLKSGGFLVIEQTEAFVSIDVNTGKYVSNKKSQETYHKINLEAAREIAAQLRLRNLSGIILVDFINLDSREYEDELMYELKKCLKKDRVKTDVVDMTALKIVEITRQKVKKPVAEEYEALAFQPESEESLA